MIRVYPVLLFAIIAIGFPWNLSAEERAPFQIAGYGDVEYFISSNPDLFDEYRIRNFVLETEHSQDDRFIFKAKFRFEDAPYIIGNRHKKDALYSTGGSLKLENLFIIGKFFPFFSFAAGRFPLPAGIWNLNDDSTEVSTQIRPLHIRNIFPHTQDGFQIQGIIPISDFELQTRLFHGNGEGNKGGRDNNREKASGYRLSMNLPFGKMMSFGTTRFTDEKNAVTDYKKTAQGFDFLLDIWKIRLQMEHSTALFEYKGINPEIFNFKRKGNYYQAGFFHGKLSVYVRSDYYDPDSENVIDAVITNTLAFNYQLSQAMIAKLEHHIIDLEDLNQEDYQITIISLTASFGD